MHVCGHGGNLTAAGAAALDWRRDATDTPGKCSELFGREWVNLGIGAGRDPNRSGPSTSSPDNTYQERKMYAKLSTHKKNRSSRAETGSIRRRRNAACREQQTKNADGQMFSGRGGRNKSSSAAI